MKPEDFLDMCENGNARVMYSTILILQSRDGIWISFDGFDWEKTDSKLISDMCLL